MHDQASVSPVAHTSVKAHINASYMKLLILYE